LPRLLMPSSFCFPPVEDSLGTMPTQAENSRPFSKSSSVSNCRNEGSCCHRANAWNSQQDSFSRDVRSMVPSASPMKFANSSSSCFS